MGSEKQFKSLKETLEEYDLDLPLSSFGDLIPHKPQLVLGNLSNGFYFADEKLVLVTEREIFHKKVKRRARARFFMFIIVLKPLIKKFLNYMS